MDPVVTARVPADVRARGVEVLGKIGATTSELVNAAFAYVIAEQRLPKPRARLAEGPRTMTQEQEGEFAAFMADVHVAVDPEWEDASFEQLLSAAMGERYEDFR